MNLKKEIALFSISNKLRIMDRMEDAVAFIFISIGLLIRVAVTVIFFQAIYLQVNVIGGWNFDQVVVLMGTFFLIEGIGWATYIRGLNRLPHLIESGDLDSLIIKPINLRTFFIYKNIDLVFNTVQLVAGIGMILYVVFKNNMFLELPYFLFFILCGLIIHYSFTFILATINFFYLIPQSTYLQSEVFELGRFPITIYKGLAKLALSIIIPIAFIFSVPVEIMFGGLSLQILLSTLGITTLFYLISKYFWRAGLRRYESANG